MVKKFKLIFPALAATLLCLCIPLSGCLSVGLLTLFSLSSCSSNPANEVKKYTGVNLTGCDVVYSFDDHGGMGDGETLYTFDCSEKKEEVAAAVGGWAPLPLLDNLQLFTYGGEKNGVEYGVSETRALIPEISEGFYYFVDRYALEYEEDSDPYSDEKLFSRYSYNLTLAMYDSASDRFYFYKLDT